MCLKAVCLMRRDALCKNKVKICKDLARGQEPFLKEILWELYILTYKKIESHGYDDNFPEK
jgi:hypothetical protein